LDILQKLDYSLQLKLITRKKEPDLRLTEIYVKILTDTYL
jgi:hypothetical protein